MRINFAQEARAEFAHSIRRCARDAGAAQARAFSAEVHHMNTLIAAHPDMGRRLSTGAGIWCWIVFHSVSCIAMPRIP